MQVHRAKNSVIIFSSPVSCATLCLSWGGGSYSGPLGRDGTEFHLPDYASETQETDSSRKSAKMHLAIFYFLQLVYIRRKPEIVAAWGTFLYAINHLRVKIGSLWNFCESTKACFFSVISSNFQSFSQ